MAARISAKGWLLQAYMHIQHTTTLQPHYHTLQHYNTLPRTGSSRLTSRYACCAYAGLGAVELGGDLTFIQKYIHTNNANLRVFPSLHTHTDMHTCTYNTYNTRAHTHTHTHTHARARN